MTVEPIYTDATERTYATLAGFRRAADRAQGTFPLKRFLSAILDQFGQVWQLYQRIDALAPDEPGADNRPLTLYQNLAVNPSYEDAAPLPLTTTRAPFAAIFGGWISATRAMFTPGAPRVAPDPWMIAALQQPSTLTNATAGLAAMSSWTDGGAQAWRFVAIADGTFGGIVTATRMTVEPGQLLVSADVWAPTGRTVRWSAQPVNAVGAAIGPPVTADVAYRGPGFEREEVSLLMPAETAGVDLSMFVMTGVAGDRLTVDCLLAHQTGVRGLPYRRYAGVLTGDTSDLVNPDTADDRWLDWLGQLVGVRLPRGLSHQARVDAVKYAPAGWQAGTKAAVANAARTALTGSKYAVVYDHSTDALDGLGTSSMWDVLIVTRQEETPDPTAVLAAVIAKGAKPAGVTLHIRAYTPTWGQVVGQYPTWSAIAAAGSWAKIEEAGLV